MVGEAVELPMATPKVSFSSADDQLDPRELAISELFSAPCPDAPSEPEIGPPEDFSDSITPIDVVGDTLSSGTCTDSAIEANSDRAALPDAARSEHVEGLEVDIDASAHERPQNATSIGDDVYRVVGTAFASCPILSQDHSEVVCEVLVSNSAHGVPSQTVQSTMSGEQDTTTTAQLPSVAIEDKNMTLSDTSSRKGKQKVKDDENSEHQQPKKRRRRPAATILTESLVMNSRSTSPSLSDTSSLSPLSEDEEVARDRQPTKKRRRKEGGSKFSAGGVIDAHTSECVAVPTHATNALEAESEPTTPADQSSSETAVIDASSKAEMRGFLIQAMGLSRASSMPASSLLREVLREQPQLAHQRTKGEWLSLIEDTLAYAPGCTVFGRIDRSGMDAADKPLEAQWFYIPEMDEDQDRAALLQDMMPKKKRTAKDSSIRSKQYYYRPLGKMSRWDAEEDA